MADEAGRDATDAGRASELATDAGRAIEVMPSIIELATTDAGRDATDDAGPDTATKVELCTPTQSEAATDGGFSQAEVPSLTTLPADDMSWIHDMLMTWRKPTCLPSDAKNTWAKGYG